MPCGAFAIAVVLSTVLFEPVAIACPRQETAEQFIERALKAIERDEWGRAKSGVRHALGIEPSSPQANFIAAQVYLHEGARSMAIDYLERAIKARPVYPEAHLMLAKCLLLACKLDNSKEEVNTAIAQGAPPFASYRLLGEIEVAQGDYERAAQTFEKTVALAQATDHAEVDHVAREMQDLRKAIAYLTRFEAVEAEQKAPSVIRPVLLNRPQPRYSREAENLKIQGSVLMVIVVSETGSVESVVTIRRLGFGLDEQGEEAARTSKFSPATKNGTPIPFVMKILIEFNLR